MRGSGAPNEVRKQSGENAAISVPSRHALAVEMFEVGDHEFSRGSERLADLADGDRPLAPDKVADRFRQIAIGSIGKEQFGVYPDQLSLRQCVLNHPIGARKASSVFGSELGKFGWLKRGLLESLQQSVEHGSVLVGERRREFRIAHKPPLDSNGAALLQKLEERPGQLGSAFGSIAAGLPWTSSRGFRSGSAAVPSTVQSELLPPCTASSSERR